jgi:hypothetical protein
LWRIFTALPRVRQGIQLSIVYAMDVENTREFCEGGKQKIHQTAKAV